MSAADRAVGDCLDLARGIRSLWQAEHFPIPFHAELANDGSGRVVNVPHRPTPVLRPIPNRVRRMTVPTRLAELPPWVVAGTAVVATHGSLSVAEVAPLVAPAAPLASMQPPAVVDQAAQIAPEGARSTSPTPAFMEAAHTLELLRKRSLEMQGRKRRRRAQAT